MATAVLEEWARRGVYGEKESMLIDIVQFIQEPERVIPSLVRSACLDSIRYVSGNPHHHHFSWKFVVVFLKTPVDRKINLSRVPGIDG
jgi:hypothetical protein